jgi:ABC-2 type transport system permease protein
LAVHRRRFQAYEGELTPVSTRFAVVARYALRELFESRVFLMLFVATCAPLVAGVAQVYLNHNATARALLHMQPDLFAINNLFFFRVISVQAVLAIVLAAWAGPVLIAPDLAGGALPLYLSRPLSRPQYLFGKMATILGLLSAVTWVPALALFALEAGLTGGSWFWDNGWIARAVFLGAGMWIGLLAFLVVTCSVWVRWRIAATGLFIGVFAVGQAAARMLGRMFDSNWGRLLDINYLVTTVWWDLFRLQRPVRAPRGAPAPDLPWWAARVAMTVICALCVLILDRRLRAREVVR